MAYKFWEDYKQVYYQVLHLLFAPRGTQPPCSLIPLALIKALHVRRQDSVALLHVGGYAPGTRPFEVGDVLQVS